MHCFALIPAAGLSRRMGRPKLSLPLGGRTILEHVVSAVHDAGVAQTLVVVGPATEFLRPLAEKAGACVHVLPDETPDMRATVQAGLIRIEQMSQPRDDDTWLLLPADHPTLSADVVRQLLDAAQKQLRHSVFVPTHAGQRGHPTLFRWWHVAGIRDLPAEQGLNAYIRAHGEEVFELTWPSAQVLLDLDTPEEYERLMRRVAQDRAANVAGERAQRFES